MPDSLKPTHYERFLALHRVDLQTAESYPRRVKYCNGAEAQLYSALNQQASLLSHFDCFTGLIVPAFASLLLALTIKNFRPPGKPTGAH